MDIEKFTEKAQQAIQSAQEIALRSGHQQVDVEHIHLALLTQEDGLIPKLISFMGENVPLIAKDVERELDKMPKVYGSGATSLYATRRFNEVLIHAGVFIPSLRNITYSLPSFEKPPMPLKLISSSCSIGISLYS
jgi:ATP-dependent Clp protease ATP-binding subunit ClpB